TTDTVRTFPDSEYGLPGQDFFDDSFFGCHFRDSQIDNG
ncbi:unnamed protein product, partial [marine sediment metagenome]